MCWGKKKQKQKKFQQYIRITLVEFDYRTKCDYGKCQSFTAHGKERSEYAAIRMSAPQATLTGETQWKKKTRVQIPGQTGSVTARAKSESTCLNWIIMSLDSSMSLNIPSSLLVNAAPHSGEVKNHNTIVSLQMTCCHSASPLNASSAILTLEEDRDNFQLKGIKKKSV